MTLTSNDVFKLKRHHLLANWDTDYLKYFLQNKLKFKLYIFFFGKF